MPASEVELVLVGGAVTLVVGAATQLLTARAAAQAAERAARAERERLTLQLEAERALAADAAAVANRGEMRPLLKEAAASLYEMVEQLSVDYAVVAFDDGLDPQAATDSIKAARRVLGGLELELGPVHPLVIAAGDCVRAAAVVQVYIANGTQGTIVNDEEQLQMIEQASRRELAVMRDSRGAFFRLTAHSVGIEVPFELPDDEAEDHAMRVARLGPDYSPWR